MKRTRGPWQIHGERIAYENPWMRVAEYEVTRPDGKPGLYGVVGFANIAIAVLPLFPDGTTMLVGQHRFPRDRYSWEIPEGGGALDVPPLNSAKRELKEETGLTARAWREVLRLDLSNSITDETAIGYIASDIAEGEPEPEGTEDLLTRRLPFRDALAEAMSGKITDALTVAMLLRAYYMALEGELDETLAAAMLKR
ncbi:NUDIX hydrolase [Maricaulis sp.]|jgi:8-oxo-dGTP pyrophosphatase MutT (NUDIX family)|uniref:NUDIX domain-containing protein n=1 Tax=Maricaulis sp. TaxID=1486257 RepID=UPI002625A39F|nr:NUDIX hydrolase [Maricaulis sp.]